MIQSYDDNDVVIVDGCRTPVGKLNGCVKTLAAHQLGSIVIKKLIEKCQLKSEDVSEVIMGQALTAGIKIVVAIRVVLVFLLLSLNIFHTLLYCFYC